MQNLKKLIQLIGYKGNKYIALFEKQHIKPGKEQSLFQGIINSSFQNDHSAAKILYQSLPEDTRYNILKSRLEEKLLNYLVFVDLIEGSQKKDRGPKGRCELHLYQARVLFENQEYQICERILKKIIRTCKEYELTAILVESLELLLKLYSTTQTILCYQSLKNDFIQYQNTLAGERTAALLYQEAQWRFLTVKLDQENLQYIATIAHKLQDLWKEIQSFTCFDFYYRLHTQQLEHEESYQQLLVLTNFAEEFVKDLKINCKRFNYSHNYALRIHAYLRTGELVNGLQLAKEGVTLFEPSSEAWVSYFESYFLIAIHSQNYSLALDLYKQVEQNIFFKKASSLLKERWYLYRGYLDWMYEKKTILTLEEHLIKQILPSFSKDKQGYNIAILILQFCHYLYTNQKNLLIKKAETYKKYIERHFQNNSLGRERIFFLLMLLIIRHNFHYEQVY
jgi:hypothetical protein